MMQLDQDELICPYCMNEQNEIGFEYHVLQCEPQNRIPCEICRNTIKFEDYDVHVAQHLENGGQQLHQHPQLQSQQQQRTSLPQRSRSRSPHSQFQEQRQLSTSGQRQYEESELRFGLVLRLIELMIRPRGFNKESLSGLIEFQCTKVGEECTVCMEVVELQENIILLPCAHQYHSDCIKKWLEVSKSCPICKKEVEL